MKEIIAAIPKEVLEKELTEDKFMRVTNYGNNHLYSVTHHDSPNVMLEIGRLRELTFRAAKGGTGKDADIDDYDTCSKPYSQLIVWNPESKEILGGYRYILCKNAEKDDEGNFKLATRGLFEFSEKFVNEYLPLTIELGRSFVVPSYQATGGGKQSLFTLDNLWDGLGALIIDHPEIKYFFGKVTMYTTYNQLARDLILYFFKKRFPDNLGLMKPHKPLSFHHSEKKLQGILNGNTYQEDYKILSQNVRSLGENIPPLINTYMNTSPNMMSFGTAMNYKFGEVEETGIIIHIPDIFPQKKDRHINTYIEQKKSGS
ncbi:MAG: GNAT family N-acetyltransferase [Bacteroidales bacterium]|nr:GNAT family N-acetyltransferase [Bacteroidales bacterium]